MHRYKFDKKLQTSHFDLSTLVVLVLSSNEIRMFMHICVYIYIYVEHKLYEKDRLHEVLIAMTIFIQTS